jgi:predicted MFS family arabinose efflux permease
MPRHLILGLCVLAFAASSNTQSFDLVFARVAEGLGLSLPQLGGLRTLEYAASIIVAILAAPLLDRFPRKWILVLAFGCAGLGVAALVTLDNLIGLVAFFVLNGASVVLAFSTMMALPGDFVGGRSLNRVIGLVIGSLAFTAILVSPLVGRVADAAGWRAGMLVSGGVAFVALLVAIAFVPRYPARSKGPSSSGFVGRYRGIVANRLLVGMLGTAMLRFAQVAGLMTFLSAVLIERYELSLGTIGMIFALAGIMFFAGSVSSGALLHAFRIDRLLGHGGFLAAALFVLMLVTDPGVALMVVGFVALIGVFAAQEAASTIALLRLAPDQRGAAMSGNELVAGVGALVGIGAAALGYQISGVSGIGFVLVTLAVGGGVGSLLVLRRTGSLDDDRPLEPAPSFHPPQRIER